MSAPAELPDVLPIFPLGGAILLPRGRLPLNIFEPRYLQMVDDVLRSDHRLIGMIQPRVEGDRRRLYHIGCAGRLVAFSETGDGRYLISLRGISRFRLLDVRDGFTPYLRGQVAWDAFAADTGAPETDPGLDRERLRALVGDYLGRLGIDMSLEELDDGEDEHVINALAMVCPFPADEKQALLEAPGLAARRKALMALLEIHAHARNDEEDRLQ
ncbi:MAG: ATP-dependent protease [Alphaproteobacteria bacterium]|nr:MAG: ATP-dependent protease [Alphaproteobacteria bacterium]